MGIARNEGIILPSLSARDFEKLSGYINAHTGIKMTGGKKSLFESRLQKRLRHLGLKDFGEYCDFLFSGEGSEAELHHMIDAVTTHKTDFFREPDHFDLLSSFVLPELMKNGKDRFLVWSAACSTGEEPYTIAMVLSEFGEKFSPGCLKRFSVLATDISTGAIASGKQAVYREDQAVPIPPDLRKKYLLRSKNRSKRLVRVVPELRDVVCFRRLNLIEDDFGSVEQADIIFCRNVIIYFDMDVQRKLLFRLYGKLAPGGYLFMGHSEAIHGFGLQLAKAGPSVYRKTEKP